MADYYPLIARAISGLDPSAPGESRRALYERARAALIQQLRSVDPPLSESEITRERLSLEEAVRKVESEAAQRARDASRPPATPPRAGDALRRAGARPGEAPSNGAATAQGAAARPPRPGASPGPSSPRNDRSPSAPEEQRPPRNLRPDAGGPPRPQSPPPGGAAAGPSAPPVGLQEPQLAPGRERPPGAPRRPGEGGAPQGPGVRGFRDITADADDLGRAAAQANRAAR